MLSIYPACFFKEKEGNYSVIFPVLGIATCGDTINEAMEMAVDCLAGYLYDAKIEKVEVPKPPKMEDINIDSEYDEYETGFVNMVTVDVDEYAVDVGCVLAARLQARHVGVLHEPQGQDRAGQAVGEHHVADEQ